MAIRRDSDIADKIARRPRRAFDDFERPRRGEFPVFIKREFVNRRLRSSANPQRASVGRKREAKPRVGYRSATDLMTILGIQHAQRWRIVASVHHDQEAAVLR